MNQSFEAKLAVKVSDLTMRRMISQDYTSDATLESNEGLQWMQNEFSTMDLFDPAQLNLLILQSGLSYQFLRELESKKDQKAETAFGYLALQNLWNCYG